MLNVLQARHPGTHCSPQQCWVYSRARCSCHNRRSGRQPEQEMISGGQPEYVIFYQLLINALQHAYLIIRTAIGEPSRDALEHFQTKLYPELKTTVATWKNTPDLDAYVKALWVEWLVEARDLAQRASDELSAQHVADEPAEVQQPTIPRVSEPQLPTVPKMMPIVAPLTGSITDEDARIFLSRGQNPGNSKTRLLYTITLW